MKNCSQTRQRTSFYDLYFKRFSKPSKSRKPSGSGRFTRAADPLSEPLSRRPRIYHGQKSIKMEFPWFVAVDPKKCGGTIIAKSVSNLTLNGSYRGHGLVIVVKPPCLRQLPQWYKMLQPDMYFSILSQRVIVLLMLNRKTWRLWLDPS